MAGAATKPKIHHGDTELHGEKQNQELTILRLRGLTSRTGYGHREIPENTEKRKDSMRICGDD